jgi:hypothetical protein
LADTASDRLSPPLLGPQRTLKEQWSVQRQREGVRTYLAVGLLVLFGIVIVTALADVTAGYFTGRARFADLRDVVEQVLSPVVALLGAVGGFYFGVSKSRSANVDHDEEDA